MRTIKRRTDTDQSETKKISRRRRKRAQLASNVANDIKSRKKATDAPVEFLHSGSHCLNLALSGKARNGGWARARVNNIVGDGSSGKTLCMLELCYWCFRMIKKIRSRIFGRVKKVIIVYNNCEGVMDFPLKKMYGQEFIDAVEWICIKDIQASGRDYIRRMKALKKGEFLLYIVDSWDAMLSPEEIARFEKSIKEDKDLDGSYGTEIYKYIGKFFAYTTGLMNDNGKDATLMIVSQVRHNIGVKFGKKYKRTGGKALDFYTHIVAWIAQVKKINRTKRGRKRVTAIDSVVKVERSKVGRPFNEVEFRILMDFGIDDIGSMLNFLKINGSGMIKFDGKSFGSLHELIRQIQSDKTLFEKLINMTEDEWYATDEEFDQEVQEREKLY